MKTIDFEKYSFDILYRMVYSKSYMNALTKKQQEKLIDEFCAKCDDFLLSEYLG